MHGPLRLGLPTVDLHATFAAPCRLGETLEIAVANREVGGASVVPTATVTVPAAARFHVTLNQVRMDLDTARPLSWPPEWRARQALPSTTDSNPPPRPPPPPPPPPAP